MNRKKTAFILILLCLLSALVCGTTVPAAEKIMKDSVTVTVGDPVPTTFAVGVGPGQKAPTWKISNKKVVKKINGIFYAAKAGKCKLTLKNSKKTFGVINVKVKKRKVITDSMTVWLNSGNEIYVPQVASSEPAEPLARKWTSSNKKVAVVKNNIIVPKKRGTCTLKLKSSLCTYYKIKVTVKQPVKKITLNKTNLTLKKGSTFQLKIKLSPKNTDLKKFKWRSSDEDVVKVSSKGKLKAVGRGSAWISIEPKEQQEVNYSVEYPSCEVNVVVPISSITLRKTSETFVINEQRSCVGSVSRENYPERYIRVEKILPEEAGYDTEYSYFSENNKVAKVNEHGEITPVGAGTTNILAKVTTPAGTKTVKESVTVIDMNDFYKEVTLTKDNFLTYFGIGNYTWYERDSWGNIENTYQYKTFTNKISKDWIFYNLSEDFLVRVDEEYKDSEGNIQTEKNVDFSYLFSCSLVNNLVKITPTRVRGKAIFLNRKAVKGVAQKSTTVNGNPVKYKVVQLIGGGELDFFNVENALLRRTDYIYQ